MSINATRHQRDTLRQLLHSLRVALWIVVLIFLPLEVRHIYLVFQTPEPLISWLASMNSEWFYHLIWAIFGIVIIQRSLNFPGKMALKDSLSDISKHQQPEEPHQLGWLDNVQVIAITCGLVTLIINLYVAWNLGDHHPVYHDEYSYLFQAETFLKGRLSNPRFEDAPELFDQVHVLNLREGMFASRYFPCVGLFLIPGLVLGLPHLTYWLAGSLITYLIALTAFELSGSRAAWWSGMICALLPGYPLFANLLLSHHPTLLGLCWFLYWQLRLMKTPSMGYALLAGLGLSFAMLCRPMTAAGFAFPFGIWWVIHILGLKSGAFLSSRISHILSMGMPLIVGIVVMFIYNHSTTGSYLVTPYQEYTDNYTPSHVYGFYNKSRGAANIQAAMNAGHPLPVLKNYDDWAEELTPKLAIHKAWTRLQATGIWTIGIIPLLMMLIVYLRCWRSIAQKSGWLLAAVVSLHVAHIPYWYEGIFYWHYVLESGVLIALLLGLFTANLIREVNQLPHKTIAYWWYGALVITAVTSYTSFEPFWPSWLNNGISQIQYSDQKIAEAEQIINKTCGDRLSLVVIKPDPTDLHLDFVVNHPDLLQQKILRARFLPEKYPPSSLRRLFPDRQLWMYDVKTKTMLQITE